MGKFRRTGKIEAEVIVGCDSRLLSGVPLFSLLDDEEREVLAAHVDVRRFDTHARIYRKGDNDGRGYVLIDGQVRITLIDNDEQEVVLDEPEPGGFFGFASLLEGTAHLTNAVAMIPSTCLEIDREDLLQLLIKKPEAGMDMLAVLGKQFHSTQRLVQDRSLRSANEMYEEQATLGDRVADAVARFGGSWSFIIRFALVLLAYTGWNIWLGSGAWDPYPFILLNLFLSMLAAMQAPVIMMSQNRQDAKDRLRGELDFEVNRRAEKEIRHLSGKIHTLSEQVADLERLLRG